MKIKKSAIDRKRDLTKERILNTTHLTSDELLSLYSNTLYGYNETKVEDMREMYGKNEIRYSKRRTLLNKIIESFINPFSVILLVLAIASFFTDIIIPAMEKKEIDISAVIIIMVMVLLSGMVRFVQEMRSDKAAKKLRELVKTTATVQRDETGKIEIRVTDIVVGDIVFLAAGDMVPADLRIINAKDLFIAQSSLTGESEPVEKFDKPLNINSQNLLDFNNLAFMGTNVISGSAMGIILATGSDTILGSMAKQIEEKGTVTSFEKGVRSVSWVLIRFMLVMVPIVFFINGFTKGDWLQSFLFAISIAIGLTPEMLPVIVSANLAKSAIVMAKKKVIVKRLNSIQNFGAIDVLCVDKTGTITEDKVTLMHSLNIYGEEDERVLSFGFLNSYYQTGLKNLMDLAIIERSEKNNVAKSYKDFFKIDEIPFDFNRRRMSVVVKKNDSEKTEIITKGAIEEMLNISKYAEYKNKIEPLTDEIKKEILDTVANYNNNGMRVIGIAYKNEQLPAGEFSVKNESDMVLMGYLAFLDPPKESVIEAIKALREYGVDVKVLTGDNDKVTKYVSSKVGIKSDSIILGSEIENMDDETLKKVVEANNVFAKLSPAQKSRIVSALRENGHIVGFMGDGINDTPAMKLSDVGISVDTAVDIAKETADIILLEKNLMVLEKGVIEGRKTYANTIKYIKMTASSNFGNVFSVLIASSFLPFLPMLPIQLLVLNLIYDISCLAVPWDNVDSYYIKTPRKWDASSISKFMIWIGPASSVFDIVTYLVMFFVICPLAIGGNYYNLLSTDKRTFMMLFHTGWFIESLWSQTLVIHMIRTPFLPFIESRASKRLIIMTLAGITFGTILPYTTIGKVLNMEHLPIIYFPILLMIIFMYMILATILKKIFIRRYGELL